MRRSPDDAVAAVLRDHYQTEEADAGLRSLDLSAVGGGASVPGTLSDRRLDRLARQEEHRRARAALTAIGARRAALLALAYGAGLRDRDAAEPGRVRAPQGERNWRVRLREIFGVPESAIVLASPLALELHGEAGSGAGPLVAWLLGRGREHAERIWEDALGELEKARTAFAAAYEPARGPRLDAPPGRRRTKGRDMARARALASSLGSGHKIRS